MIERRTDQQRNKIEGGQNYEENILLEIPVLTHIGHTLISADHIGPPRIQYQFPVFPLYNHFMVTRGVVAGFRILV